MKQNGFDERLDGILARAAIRLQERMRLAYFRGNLASYLARIGLADYMDSERLKTGSLLELQDEAAVVLAACLRQSRKKGYLKDFLKQLNMLELLTEDKHLTTVNVHITRRPKAAAELSVVKKVTLIGAPAEKVAPPASTTKEDRLKNFKLIK